MCNTVSTSVWQELEEGTTRREGREGKEGTAERHRKCWDSGSSSMQRVTGIQASSSDVHWMITADSPLQLTDFQTECVRACVCVRGCVCVSFYFLAIPLFVVCCFLLCLYNWKISYFSIVVTLDDIWFVEKKNVLWLLSNGLNILCFDFFFFSPDEKKGWILNGGQGYKRHNNNHSVLARHGNIWLIDSEI